MKRFLVFISLMILTMPCFAAEKFSLEHALKTKQNCESHSFISQRGCCSHHGGVGGCSHGRVVCNDGSLSPSCRCLKDDIQINNKFDYGYRL